MKKTTETLQNIPLKQILSTRSNPRSDLENNDALCGLAASLGSEDDPKLVGPPVVEEIDPQTFRTLAGERRIQAARLAGWQTIPCLVRPQLDPLEAHELRLIENLHRQPLHPLDKAAALKIAWLNANAAAIGLEYAAREILKKEQLPTETLTGLTALLETNGFTATHPTVCWDQMLNRLGIELNPASRKKLIAVLGVDAGVQEQVRSLDITEAALRSLGQLEPADQVVLVETLESDPDLTRRVRRISHAVRQQGYTLDEAISEAQGQVVGGAEHEQETDPVNDDDFLTDDTMDTVLQLLEAANQITTAISALNTLLDGRIPADLPTPWGEYATESLAMIQAASQSITLAPRRI